MIQSRALPMILVIGVLTGAAAAQRSAPPPPPPEDVQPLAEQSRIQFEWVIGGEYQDETDIEGGGDVSVTRAQTSLGVRTSFSPELSASFRVGLSLDDYDFDGDRGLPALEPWEDIYTVTVGATLSYALSNDWSIFGGPIFQIAREGSFDHSDAWIGGGILGATYNVSPDLKLGFGLGAVSQIEDDTQLFPVIIVNWEFTNRLKLTNGERRASGPGGGLELVYDVGEGFEVALGGAYERRRFRLDDDGFNPDGVGQEERFIGYGRLSYQAYPRIRFDLYAGAVMGGQLRLENRRGNKIREEDYDSPAGFVALYMSVRF